MVTRSLARVLVVAALCVLVGLATACSRDTGEDTTARDVAVYRSVIADLVDRSVVELDDSQGSPVLYVEGLGALIPLAVQVGVVAAFADDYEIRFIDDLAEAIEADEPHRPVRGDGLLVGLGPVVVDGGATLRGEFYVREGDVAAFGYELSLQGDGTWAIVGDPEPIAPEGFVTDP